jgi:hypothetical protein
VPESVPTQALARGRYAIVKGTPTVAGTLLFDSSSGAAFTTGDTAGCGCEQILTATAKTGDERRYGCTADTMRSWVKMVRNATR